MMRDFHKKILALGMLLVVIVWVVLWQTGYLEPVLSRLKATIAPELPLAEDSGLDLSEVDIESLLDQEEEEEEEEEEPVFAPEEALPSKGGPIIVFEPKIGQIQEKINEISEEVERIDSEVKKLVLLTEIQRGIDEISEKTAQIGQELEKLS